MTTEEKTSRSVENPYATTNKKPSPSAFVIWLIATIVLLGGAIGLGIATYHWGSSGIEVENYRKELSEEIKKEIEQPCEEFESFINACKSGELDNDRDLAPYWDSYVNAMGSRDIDHFRQSTWSMESSSNYVDWYDVRDIAKNVGFMKDEYNSFGSLVDTNVIDAKYADEFEKVLLERINEIMRTELRELESDNYYNEVAIRFLISCIVCLILGVIGVFVTLSRRKKLKQGRVAYENAALSSLSSQQATSSPTSVNGSKSIKQSSAFMSNKRGLIEVLEDIQDDKEGFVKFLLVVAFAPLKLVIRTITLPSMCAALSKANKASKEIAAEYNALKAEGYENASRRKAREAYEKANTSQEKMAFFYGYFSSAENCKKPTLCAYIMMYLAENSSLFDKNDPLKLALYFTVDVDKALYSLLGLNPKKMPHGRYYEHLLRKNDEELNFDKYILQCLIIAANGGEGDSIPLYKYDILGQECVPEDAE